VLIILFNYNKGLNKFYITRCCT